MRRFFANLAVMLTVVVIVSAGIGLAIAAVIPDNEPETSNGDNQAAGKSSAPPSAASHAASSGNTSSLPSSSRSPGATATSRPSPTPPEPVRVVAVEAYDPLGSGHEHDDEAALAIDGNPTTVWPTEHYSTPGFGGLKSGTGLLVDLGKPVAINTVQLRLAGGGADFQLRAGNTTGPLGDLPVVAAVDDAGRTPTLEPPNARARYWLVWFTRLPSEDGHYRGGVAEIKFTG